jgi:hypothetical protein
MRRIATAALLAAPLLLGTAGTSPANNGPCTFGLGCGGYALRLFPLIHQHGPLFNYGPYYGYPPFEPYGYWNSYLQYTGPVPPPNPAYNSGNAYGWNHGGHGGVFPRGGAGCSTCGGGLLHGHKRGCNSCGASAANIVTSGDALDRFSGRGTAAASAAYYADGPGAVITVGYSGR